MRVRLLTTLAIGAAAGSTLAWQLACTLRPSGRSPVDPGYDPSYDSSVTSAPDSWVGTDDVTCAAYEAPRAQVLTPVADEVAPLLAQMTMGEKIALLSGGPICPNYDCDFEGTGLPSLDIPDFKMRDGPRGVHQLSGGRSTTWAIAEARAAAFDVDLEYRVGQAQGKEMRAFKYDLALAPTLNVLRHPGWARAQETYGEDPVLSGELGAAFVRGVQEHVPACPKHFAANNTDDNRNTTIAYMDEQTLRENYTRAFGIVIEKADPACVMAAYNGVNGDWCCENHHLLTEILRDEWGWAGFVVSDWWATKSHGDLSINAGLDLEMPDNRAFEQLPSAVQDGLVTPARIDEAVTRILNARIKFGHLTSAYQASPLNSGITSDAGHRQLARETAEEGAVLLKNDGLLPLGAKAIEYGVGAPDVTSILVLGPDALLPDTTVTTAGRASGLGDRGSSNTIPPYAVSFFQGLTDRATGITVTTSDDVAAAAQADVVIIPVAMAHEDEGEAFDGGQDRQGLTLGSFHPKHWGTTKPSQLIQAAAAVNPNVVVVLAVGSAIVMEDWMGSVKAIVQTFYPGQEGGNALARLLFGDVNFSGKLPFTVARDAADYPAFQNKTNTATFDYLHGYRKFEQEGQTPRFWFGYGLSYTTYAYSDLQVLCTQGVSATGRLNVQVTVTNTGPASGEEIVQLYVGYPNTGARRPPKELKAFTRVALAPGERKQVQLSVPAKELAYWDETQDAWVVEKVSHTVFVGPSADPSQLLSASFTIQ